MNTSEMTFPAQETQWGLQEEFLVSQPPNFSIVFFKKIIFVFIYVWTPYVCSAHRGWKRKSDPLWLELACNCKLLDVGAGYCPLEEQQALLTAEPSL